MIVFLHNPREERALRALLDGPLRREQLDRAAGVSNGPDLVMNLRRDWRLEIPCKRVPVIDRDGRRVKVGLYALSANDRSKVLAWLNALAKFLSSEDDTPNGYVS